MWNKLVSNHTDILYPLLESLKNLRTDHEQEKEIKKLNRCPDAEDLYRRLPNKETSEE